MKTAVRLSVAAALAGLVIMSLAAGIAAAEPAPLLPPPFTADVDGSTINISLTHPNDYGRCGAVVLPTGAELAWENYVWPKLEGFDYAIFPATHETMTYSIPDVAVSSYNVITECWDSASSQYARNEPKVVVVAPAPVTAPSSGSRDGLNFGS
ncbi:hypothetical protein ACFTZB_01080 [Rhodococcus sp. NPDC057014]|uniref:hypothetical protein n=1 Tax=Rhodococcus sp. NPDC057014 TaxID=3346000 RepID=UPI0036413CB0